MPIYEYKCNKCSKHFEVQKSMKDPHPDVCMFCGKKKSVEHVISSINIGYVNRPIWTYPEVLKYKQFSVDGGPPMKVDKNKHGSLSSWHVDNQPVNKKKKKK